VTVTFQRVDADPDAIRLNGMIAPIEGAPDDDRRRIVVLSPARTGEQPFEFEVREAAPTPERVRIFRCIYGSILKPTH
jgi:hypothetical protein